MTHVACESKLRSVVRSPMHLHVCPDNRVSISIMLRLPRRLVQELSVGTVANGDFLEIEKR